MSNSPSSSQHHNDPWSEATPERLDQAAREMLAWLQMRKPRAMVTTLTETGWAQARLVFHPDWSNYVGPVSGRDLREALARLVVAVARREEKP